MGRSRSSECCWGGSRSGIGGHRWYWDRDVRAVMAGPKGSGDNPQGIGTGTGLWEAGAVRYCTMSSTRPGSLGFSKRDGPRPNTGARLSRVTGA